MIKHRTIPFISQLGSLDCGVACITMILNYYGIKVDIVDIGSTIHIGREGMSLVEMKSIVENYGFKFAAYKYGYKENNLKNNLPVVLCSSGHFVVVEKIKKGKYQVIDPAKGKELVSFTEIMDKYQDILVTIVPDDVVNYPQKKKIKIQVDKKRLAIVGILMLLIQGISLVVPAVVQRIVDGFADNIGIHMIKLLFIIICILLSYFIISYIRQKILLTVDMTLFKNMISQMLEKIFCVDINFFEWHAAGDIGNRFNSVNQLNDLLTNGMINIVIQAITSIVCFFAMLYSSIELTLLTILVSIVQIALMFFLNGKSAIKTRKYMQSQSSLQSELIDTLGNIVEIKCMGMDGIICNNLKDKYDCLIALFREKTNVSNIMACFVSTIQLVFPLFIYLLGSSLVLNNKMTTGSLIAFVTLVGYFTAPFSSIFLIMPSFNSIKEVLLRYKELMYFKENQFLGKELNESFENLTLNSICYSYNNSLVLNKVSMEIKQGQTIAIVGLSGSGKSTAIKAILGAIKIQQGSIFINKENIDCISREQIYKWFSIVTQNPMCLNSTIRKNVDITGKYSDTEIYDALSMAEIEEDIRNMPLGLDTIIGEGGQNISGGQRQRLAIARALISNTEVLIFDEATSNLDPITEKKIYDNLKVTNKTLIIITHRLASIQEADNIYVMMNGMVIESGNHTTLLEHRGWYYDNLIK